MKIKIIQTTTDSIKIAESISKVLVNNNASPCVQIISNVKSVYRWKNKLEQSSEILLLIKTIPEKIQQCKDIILKHHNYDVPEIIVTNWEILNDEYRYWFIDKNQKI